MMAPDGTSAGARPDPGSRGPAISAPSIRKSYSGNHTISPSRWRRQCGVGARRGGGAGAWGRVHGGMVVRGRVGRTVRLSPATGGVVWPARPCCKTFSAEPRPWGESHQTLAADVAAER